MKRVMGVVVVAACVLLSGVAVGQKKSKEGIVPGVILHARYIYVTAFTGDQLNPRAMQEDRIAITEVIDALKKWGRYAVTYDAKNADLTMVVRRGKIAAGLVGGGVSTGSRGTVPFGVAGGEGGSPDDTLMVMEGGGPPLDTSALWRASAKGGLEGPDPSLVEAFKKDVEQAAKKRP